MTQPTILRQSVDGNQRLLYRCYSATGIELVDQENTEDGWEDMNVIVLDVDVVTTLIPTLVEFVETEPTTAQLRHAVNLLFTSYVRAIAGIQARWGDPESSTQTPASAINAVIHALCVSNADVVNSVDGLVYTLNRLGIFNDVNSTGHRDEQLAYDTETWFGSGILSQE